MIAFVILHYNTIEHTLSCIDNIKNMIDTIDFHIVIVDNASPNKTGEELKLKFENEDKVTVLCSENNVGFARGNNIGFEYAKKRLMARYIILLNGDTRLLTHNLNHVIEREFRQYNTGVIGPMIISGDGKITSNPMRNSPVDLKMTAEFIDEYKNRLWGITHGITGVVWTELYDIIFKLRKKIQRRYSSISAEENTWQYRIQRRENVVLHGCFLVFTPTYIDIFDGLDERTFMYMEEDFLKRRCELNHIKVVYCPEIIIYHFEGASTENNKSLNEKRKIYYEQSLKSLGLYYDYLKEINSLLNVGSINKKCL